MKTSDKNKLITALEKCGAENISLELNAHCKLKFSHGEEKALVTISSTPSDRRAWKNIVSDIRRELERIGLVDQRFMARLILTTQPRPEDAIWNLLDKWEKRGSDPPPPEPDAEPAK